MDLKLYRVQLYVEDVPALAQWYHQKLGLPITRQDRGFYELDGGSCRLALIRHPHPVVPKTRVCFWCEDVSATRATLVERGVQMGADPGEGPGVRECEGRDPEGNVFMLTNRL